MRLLSSISLMAGALLSGCTFGTACDLAVQPGIVVTVFDADSQPLPGASGYAFNQRGRTDFSDPPAAADNELIAFVGAGIYEVVVERPGYLSWHQADVRVVEGNGTCPGVATEELEATLQSSP